MPELTFEREGHVYRVDGLVKPSLTQILRAVKVEVQDGEVTRLRSLFDYSFLDQSKADEVLLRGRWVHDLAALRLTRGPLPQKLIDRLKEMQPEWFTYYPGFETWLDTQPTLEPLIVETSMYSALYDFCTTPDLVCLFQGAPTIIEFKTGIATPDAAIQTAGQAVVIGEQKSYAHHGKLHHRFALELRPDAPARLIPHKNHGKDRNDFLSVLNVYRLLNGGLN